jgi:hypothetical protein
MSELSIHSTSMGSRSASATRTQSSLKAVEAWAFLGGALLLLQLYVWFRWVSGPYFLEIPPGPTPLPTLMKDLLLINTALVCVVFPGAVYYFLIRPWVRERRVTTDGMLLVSFGLMSFQDPFLNYTNTWCTYNSFLFNRGSWVQDVPGWHSWGIPGHMMAEPILMVMPGYSLLLLCTMLVCWFMRRVKSSYPNLSAARLIAVTFAFCVVMDVVMEAFIFVPMGFFTYPGAIKAISIFPGHYYQYPINEALMWGAVQTGFAVLRYFTDDRGRTLVERGLERVRGGALRQQGTRFLALFAGVSLIFFVCYNLPAQWFGTHAEAWPQDVQKRSYFTNGICGEGTDRLCPDPVLPMPSKTSGYIDVNGKLVLPEGTELPKIVPFDRTQ